MKKNILIILNAVMYNRGSEALIRGISEICKNDANITLVSSEDDFGPKLNIEGIDTYAKKNNYSRRSIRRYVVALLKRIKLPINIINNLQYSKLKDIASKQDIIIIIGADNYDITYNMQGELNRLHTYIRKNTKAKMILYDCSIAKRDITENLKKDFENFDIITVRETISKENIKDIVDKDKLYLCPDPAFVMNYEEIELPEIYNENGVIGINLSDLITNPKYGSESKEILNSYINMMNYILENTEKNMILVPHVMHNADLSALKKLYENYSQNDRVYLLENESLNAKQLKYIISKCDLYIGARTHSTIAAYSTNVPTLVLGYSVKSKGIAKDIFGTDEKYVLPVSDLDSDQYLVEGFKWLYENQEKIRKILEVRMPEYIERARKIKEILTNI